MRLGILLLLAPLCLSAQSGPTAGTVAGGVDMASQAFVMNHSPMSVTDFGAVGDWSDSRTAFQAAFDAARAAHRPVVIPFGNFYVSDYVDFHCVSMEGIGGLGGLGAYGSTVSSGPGKDVFTIVDSADSGTNGCDNNYFSVKNLTVLMDQSVDATLSPGWVNKKRWAFQRSAIANNPAAWTGITLGANHNVGDITITLAPAPALNSSWGFAAHGSLKIGANLVCDYHGVSGAALLNVTCGLQQANGASADAVAAVGSTVVPVNGWLYTDTADDLPAYEVGACAFAFPQRDADRASSSMTGSIWSNVRVIGIKGPIYPTNACGFYSQIPPYAAKFQNISIRGTTFGFIEAQTAMNVVTEIRGQATQDAATFDGFEIHAPVPFVAVSGNFVSMSNFQIYSGTNDYIHAPSRGVFILGPKYPGCPGCVFDQMPLGTWHITNLYNEPGDTGPSYWGPYAQIQGGMMQFKVGLMGSQPGPVIWDASASSTEDVSLLASLAPALIINGFGNKFHNAGGIPIPGAIQDNSQGGTEFDGVGTYGIKDSMQVPARFGPAGRIDGDFLRTGNDTYRSGDGLFLSPENMANWLSIGQQYVVHDATAPITGQYLVLPAHPGLVLLGRLNGSDVWKIGQSFPIGTGKIIVKARAAATTSGTIQVTSNGAQIGSGVCTWTAGVWTKCVLPFNTTGRAGEQIKVIAQWNGTDNALNPPTELDVAYVGAVPDVIPW